MSLVGRELAGRYRLDAILGVGGMATVYRGHDLRLDRPVAVKVLSSMLAADGTLAERFQREARALASLSHPAIVSVFDVGDEEGEPWLVMELVDGETLGDRIARSGRLPPEESIPIAVSVAQGLGALHATGFIHRDVKPHNVLLSSAGTARLADFGLVRGRASRDLTAPGTTLGTLAYLAPELLAGEPATPASDVYGLAAVTYEALTGRPPYPTETVTGLVEAQAAPPPLPSSIAPTLGKSFDEPLLRALGPAAERPDLGSFAAALAAAAAKPRRGDGPAIDPAAATKPIQIVPDAGLAAAATSSIGGRGARRPAGGPPLVALLVGGLLALLFLAGIVAVLGAIRPFERPAAASEPSAPTTTAAPRSREPSPPAAAPASVRPPDGIERRILELGVLIGEAQGGPDGLRGSEARELRDLLREIAVRFEQDGPGRALRSADRFVDAVEKLREDRFEGEAADRLLEAAERLRDLLAARAGEGGEDGDDDDDDD